ncbi:hypothetical protein ABR862_004894 [Pseudomonas aeruginosa]
MKALLLDVAALHAIEEFMLARQAMLNALGALPSEWQTLGIPEHDPRAKTFERLDAEYRAAEVLLADLIAAEAKHQGLIL